MPELVANCPRCGSRRITFELKAENLIPGVYAEQQRFETFCICRHCNLATIFILTEVDMRHRAFLRDGLMNINETVNGYLSIDGYVGLKDIATHAAPEHIPVEIESAFNEGATCMAVQCYNAGGAMFRLCLDHATRSMLPEMDITGLNAGIRRSLGLRLGWLFNNGYLPEALRELSACIKDDGNDGAHAGTLEKEDAEDLLDFTVALLERIYTEPKRLEIAKQRRDARRGP